MQRIINFIIDHRISFSYGLLAIFALILTFRSHSYHNSKMFNSANWLTGHFYLTTSNINGYFELSEVNERLAAENKRLNKLIFNRGPKVNVDIETRKLDFEVISGRVINNNISSPRNYLTINRGEEDGLKKDMGVITPNGMLGIVENTSSKFATVQSILNTKSSINAKVKHTNFFGSLIWNAKDFSTVQLIDVPRSASLVLGDTIISGGMSSIFPEGIPIGTIKAYDLNDSQNLFNIDVSLFNDMANLSTIYVIMNKNRKEQVQLEQETLNAE